MVYACSIFWAVGEQLKMPFWELSFLLIVKFEIFSTQRFRFCVSSSVRSYPFQKERFISLGKRMFLLFKFLPYLSAILQAMISSPEKNTSICLFSNYIRNITISQTNNWSASITLSSNFISWLKNMMDLSSVNLPTHCYLQVYPETTW